MALIRGSATFTNGSKLVNIGSGGSAVYFDDNTIVAIDGTPMRIVAVESGTPTSFQLAENWAYDTVTTTFTAWDTIEGLWEAVQSARTFESSLQNALSLAGSGSNLYGTTAAGIAATTSGEYFSVIGASAEDGISFYLNSAGVAVLQGTLATNEELEQAVIDTIAARNAAQLAQQGAEAAQGSAEDARDAATVQAGIATTQAGTATTQAGIATTQAGIATTQAGIATTKAGEADVSAQAAADSAAAALLIKEGLDARFLPNAAADPSVVGLVGGELYYNTALNRYRYFDGTVFDFVTPDGDYLLL